MRDRGNDIRRYDGKRRVIIECVRPQVDCGRFPAKRILGDRVTVEADVLADGHDVLRAVLRWRYRTERRWRETPMEPLDNDRWRAIFTADRLGKFVFGVAAWVDPFASWRRDMEKRLAAGQDVRVDALTGAMLLAAAADRARGADARQLCAAAEDLQDESRDASERARRALDPALATLAAAWPDRTHETVFERELEVQVDPVRARFSAWYELFPRSLGKAGVHGTLRDVEAHLPYVRELGFDVLYLPPVHPIGRTRRKGMNNRESAAPGDVGSPWGIGAAEGGHKAVHPDLGTVEDVRRLAEKARTQGIELALDVAFQVAPDHPYVAEHPDWFRARPDGTIQYAENPPKKYQDIYPFDFETEDWKALWQELESVFEFWVEQGVRTFRVDNPHTKTFAFWEWCIGRLNARHPDLVFLSEAFTRPRIMHRLAKLGFTQSYTYFAWRQEKWELEEYLRELSTPPVADFFRPSFWPNTPDILTEQLQTGGRPMFISRLILAATMTANYGIYGPAFELLDHAPREPGSEEYLHSEKYQIRHWDLKRPESLRHIIARVNAIRRENPALQTNESIRIHTIDNDQVIAYSKVAPATDPEEHPNIILTLVNLDPDHVQSGWVEVPLAELGLPADAPYEAHDLLGDARYRWEGAWNYVELNPRVLPAHILRLAPTAPPGHSAPRGHGTPERSRAALPAGGR